MNGSVLPSRGRVTVNQMAKAAGVSKTSMLCYIGGDRQLLIDAVARRVERAIDQLDYRPNQMARGLGRGCTQPIEALAVDTLNPYSAAIMHNVGTACRKHGYSLVVCSTDRDNEQERHHLAALQSYSVEGLVMNIFGHHPSELCALYRGLPAVLVGRQSAELDTDLVSLSNTDAVEQALDHLQQRDFHDILLVIEPLDSTSSRIERVQALNASIDRRSVLKGRILQTGDFFRDSLRAFLSVSGPGPKVLFIYNDVATLCATHQLRDLGYRLFDEVGLLALGELDWYLLAGSDITALTQPTDEIGHTAFERLLARLEGDRGPARRATFPAQLIIRGPTHPRG